jgi:RES domain-containing protein
VGRVSVRLHRVESARRARPREAFGGDGGLHVAGRWNSAGTRIVYASSSLALACLEKRVHLAEAPNEGDHVHFQIEVNEAHMLRLHAPPARWQSSPPASATARLGDDWVRSVRSVGLWVPSAIIPGEWNALLNPAHPAFPWDCIAGPLPFTWDARLFR